MSRKFLSAAVAALFTMMAAGLAAAQDRPTTSSTGTAPQGAPSSFGALPLPIRSAVSPGSVAAPNGSTTPAPPAGTVVQPATAPAPGVGAALPAASSAPVVPAPEIRPQPAGTPDYAANLQSEVFGANLFSGLFARQGATQFNPDYVIAVGDQLQLRMWGAFDFDSVLVVDPQGNVFVPHVGPIRVLGVRNQELQRVVDAAVARAFRSNVNSYASLAAAQPVRIFVGGNVKRPGLYSGTSMDSLLHFLDQAGGIDPDRGTFLAVQVKRGTTVRATVDLYAFLLQGVIPLIQLSDGDVVFVPPRQQTVRVTGLAENAKRFEFAGTGQTVAEVARLAKPLPAATHARVTRNTGPTLNTEYYALSEAGRVQLQDGDEVEFTADKKPGTITVRVQGEHLSAQEYVLPYGARLGEVLKHIQFSDRSDIDSIQLFRRSVQERQRQMLATSLKNLEAAALTARSATSDEARLRKEESELLLQWVDRAKTIQPKGQVLIAGAAARDDLLLENGDVLNVPSRDGLVLVSGEVLFPNTVAFDARLTLDDYVKRAGGYTQNADASRVVVAHRDGSYAEAQSGGLFASAESVLIRPGDEVLVLPKIDVKSRQIWKELTQIIFQLAVTAKVAAGL